MLADEFPEYGIGVRPDRRDDRVDSPARRRRRRDDRERRGRRRRGRARAQNHFHGERSGTVRDPFGHRWNIGHHLEECSPEEMQRRYDKMGNEG